MRRPTIILSTHHWFELSSYLWATSFPVYGEGERRRNKQRVALAEVAYFTLIMASRVPLPPSSAYSNAIRVSHKFLCRFSHCPQNPTFLPTSMGSVKPGVSLINPRGAPTPTPTSLAKLREPSMEQRKFTSSHRRARPLIPIVKISL